MRRLRFLALSALWSALFWVSGFVRLPRPIDGFMTRLGYDLDVLGY